MLEQYLKIGHGFFITHLYLPNIHKQVRFVAFPATEYDEVLSGYRPGQMVER